MFSKYVSFTFMLKIVYCGNHSHSKCNVAALVPHNPLTPHSAVRQGDAQQIDARLEARQIDVGRGAAGREGEELSAGDARAVVGKRGLIDDYGERAAGGADLNGRDESVEGAVCGVRGRAGTVGIHNVPGTVGLHAKTGILGTDAAAMGVFRRCVVESASCEADPRHAPEPCKF